MYGTGTVRCTGTVGNPIARSTAGAQFISALLGVIHGLSIPGGALQYRYPVQYKIGDASKTTTAVASV